MTTYYVSPSGTDSAGTTGLSGSPWKTLSYANTRIAEYDVVKIAPGTYTERLIITVPNTTWEHDGTAGTIYISGGYTPTVAWNGTRTRRPDTVGTLAGSSWLAGGGRPLVSVAASGVTLDGGSKWGIVIRHVAGRGLQVEWEGDNATIQNVRTDYCYEGGVRIFASDVLMEDCCVTRSGLQVYDPTRLFGGIPVALMVATIENTTTGTKYPERITVRGTLVQCNWGEGIAAGYGTRYVTIEECEASTNTHVNFYGNCSRDAIFRRNLAWFVVVPDITTRVQGGIAIADECGRLGKLPVNRRHCLNPQIYNNVTIGCAFGIDLRAGGTPDDRCRNEYGYTMNQATKAVGFYVGYNTVVATANSLGCIRMSTPYDDSTTQTSSLVENNVFERVGTTVAIAAAGVGHTWRNNVWRATPVARAQGSGDVVANPGLAAPNYALPDIPFDKESTDFTPVSIYDTIDFFELKSGSPAIGAASNGSAAGGVTPPSITTDFYNLSRGSGTYDCGAHEFGGTPTEGSISASFTQSDTSGDAPLSVTFTDTSTASPGTIASRLWSFGDGATSTATNPTHQYTTAGIYTPTLSVTDTTGLEDDATGSAITVNAATPPGDGATVTYGIKIVDLPTSTGTLTVTFTDTGGETPRVLIPLVTTGTTLNTPANGGLLGWGMATATQQHAMFAAAADAVSTSNTAGRRASDACILTGTGAGAINGKASLVSFSADTATLNVTDAFPAGYKAICIAICGPDALVDVQAVALGSTGTTTTHSVPFGATAALLTSCYSPTGGSSHADISWGAKASDNQVVTAWRDVDNVNPAQAISYSATGQVSRRWFGAYVDIPNDMGAAIGYRVTNSGVNETALSLALGMSDITAGQVTLPATETDYAFATGNEPGMVILWGSRNQESGATNYATVTAGAFWIAVVNDTSTGFVQIGTNDNVSPANTFSLAGDKLKIYDGDGSTVVCEGTLALTANGFSLDLSTASANDLIINYLALPVKDGVPTGEPVLGFDALPRAAVAGDEITFTDLTFANGATIIAKIIDWGDGTTEVVTGSTATHYYGDAGNYTPTLLVQTDTGQWYSKPLPAPIAVTGSLAEWALETVRPHPDGITRTSETRIWENPADGPDYYGYMSYKLNLDGIPTDYDPDPIPSAMPGKLVWYSDPANGGISFVRPDGQRATLALTFSGGGGTGGGTSLATPTGFTVPATDADGNFTISWNAVSGATSYIIQESFYPSIVREFTTTSTSYSIAGRAAGLYSYRVAAQATSGGTTISSQYTVFEACMVGGSGTTTFEKSVVTGSDDAFEFSGGSVNLTNIYILLDAAGEDAGLRFTSVTIPQGATISSAVLELYVEGIDDPNLSIAAEDTDNASTFTTSSGNVGGRTRTTASVTWNATNIGTNAVATSPDISTVIQEIVDRPGWASGNAIAIILTANTGCDLRFTSYEGTNAAPKLVVEYS